MATSLYKARESYKKAKNNLKEQMMHVHDALLKGSEVVLPAGLKGLPSTLKEHLEEVLPKVEEVKEEKVEKSKKNKNGGK